MNDEKTLLLGASGFLGSYFRKILANSSIFHATSNQSVNQNLNERFIFNKFDTEEDIDKLFKSQNISRVINCTAISDIEKCEEKPELAYWVNSKVPELLAKKCFSGSIQFIHISTDAVFSGDHFYPSEISMPNPKSIYGYSKLEGENRALEMNRTSLICRVNFIGWSNRGKSLFNYIYSNLLNNVPFIGFKDVYFTPLYAADTAGIILRLANGKHIGRYHVVGSERLSKFDFAQLIARKIHANGKLIKSGSVDQSSFGLKRSKDLSLSNVKLRELGIGVPSLSEGLDKLIVELEDIIEI